MTAWCIARSPLILGGNLPKNDEFELSLLTNDEVIAVNQKSGKWPAGLQSGQSHRMGRGCARKPWTNTWHCSTRILRRLRVVDGVVAEHRLQRRHRRRLTRRPILR